ncbi:glycosyltransferase [Calderihabitans maritimus]|nr:glycosyltransferase [Calderihabitans maritimus]
MAPMFLEKYEELVETEVIEEIKTLAGELKGVSLQHINSTAVGGGVAEILKTLVPLMEEVGLNVQWTVMEGDEEFFQVTKTFHNAFHGQPVNITQEMFEIYREVNRRNFRLIDPDVDFVIIHDQQPLGLVQAREGNQGRWIWYCHIDPTGVLEKLWNFMRPLAARFDAAIYHLPEYVKGVARREYVMPPAIDPLSEKNRPVTEEEKKAVLKKLGIDEDKPIILQVSRFDRLKDPVGVIEVYRLVKRNYSCQLVLAGGEASDDPEGIQVLREVLKTAGDDPDIHVLALDPKSDLEINVLQQSAAVVVQKSVREGFGLTATEALWKGRPVVTTGVGGLGRQVIHGKTGLVTTTTEDMASAVERLLADRAYAAILGAAGKEHVRSNFILPVYLRSWLRLLRDLHRQGEG